MTYSHEVVRVTPELATRWLELNTKNRRLSSSRVEQYANEMTEGRWLADGSPIRFDTEDDLVDGQHRLWAIVESGVTLDLLVIRGVDEAAMATMDTGKSRSFVDILGMHDRSLNDLHSLSGVIQITYRWEQGLRGAKLQSAGNRDAVPAQVLLAFFDANRERILITHKRARAHANRNIGLSASIVGLTIWAFDQLSDGETDIDFFFARLRDGAGLELDSPILALRRYLERARLSTASVASDVLIAVTIKAVNAFRAGDTVRNLSYRRGGATPESFPVPR